MEAQEEREDKVRPALMGSYCRVVGREAQVPSPRQHREAVNAQLETQGLVTP